MLRVSRKVLVSGRCEFSGRFVLWKGTINVVAALEKSGASYLLRVISRCSCRQRARMAWMDTFGIPRVGAVDIASPCCDVVCPPVMMTDEVLDELAHLWASCNR